MSQIKFDESGSVRFIANVTPAEWKEAARRQVTGEPLRPGQRGFSGRDAAAVFGALTSASPHEVVARGDEIYVEIPLRMEQVPPEVLAEWERLAGVADAASKAEKKATSPATPSSPSASLPSDATRPNVVG